MAPDASSSAFVAATASAAKGSDDGVRAGTIPGSGAATTGASQMSAAYAYPSRAAETRTRGEALERVTSRLRDSTVRGDGVLADPASRSTLRHETSRARRAFWSKQLRQWHWVSSAVCLIGMLGFAVTGITLNHAAAIDSTPETTNTEITLPPPLVAELARAAAGSRAPMPALVARHLRDVLFVDIAGRTAEWSEQDVYVALPEPGGDAFVTIDRATGLVEYERTDRGWISYLNDLHKGRNTGRAWRLFLDVFALASVVFCLTGLALLQIHSRQRPSTWPLVALGFAVPLLLGLLLIH
jgi:hypothetical protein